MAYSKLHSSLVNSSLWCAPDPIRLLFVTFLAICDADGCVYGSRGGIARQANIKYPQKPDPFDVLMQPDPDSSDLKRHPENHGRRIIEIEGGFQLINYAFYRALRNADDRKVQNREAQQRFRAKRKPPSANVSQRKPRSAHAEAEAEADKEKSTRCARPSLKEVIEFFGMEVLANSFWDYYESNGWRVGRNPMKDWKAAARRWKREKPFTTSFSRPKERAPSYPKLPPIREVTDEELAHAREIARLEASTLRQKLKPV